MYLPKTVDEMGRSIILKKIPNVLRCM